MAWLQDSDSDEGRPDPVHSHAIGRKLGKRVLLWVLREAPQSDPGLLPSGVIRGVIEVLEEALDQRRKTPPERR